MATDTQSLIDKYETHAAKSAARMAEARAYLPGGDTRASAHYKPYPVFIERGEGARVQDIDGHTYIDFMNNFTSLIHGHAHPAVVAAIQSQAALGTAYAAPTESQIALARTLVERVPSLDQLRFTSSGSEATMMCIRASRAHTGRDRIAKFEGGYHGSYDHAEVSLVPIPERSGELDAPVSLPIDRSIAKSALTDVVVAPYNDAERAVAIIERHAPELACVIVEPVQASMGMVPATVGFLQALRDVTSRHGIVFILDEVVTLRLGPGGAQRIDGVVPDLTAMGKIIGGGLPIGAFGGRREVLEVFSPDRRDSVMHASTFSGNPMSMAAGLATFDALDRAAYDHLDALGDRLREGFNGAFRAAGIRGQSTGRGSLSQINLTDLPLSGPRDALGAMIGNATITKLIQLGMLRRGIFAAGRGMYCTSTPMTDTDVDTAMGALEETLFELRPVVEKERPALLM